MGDRIIKICVSMNNFFYNKTYSKITAICFAMTFLCFSVVEFNAMFVMAGLTLLSHWLSGKFEFDSIENY